MDNGSWLTARPLVRGATPWADRWGRATLIPESRPCYNSGITAPKGPS